MPRRRQGRDRQAPRDPWRHFARPSNVTETYSTPTITIDGPEAGWPLRGDPDETVEDRVRRDQDAQILRRARTRIPSRRAGGPGYGVDTEAGRVNITAMNAMDLSPADRRMLREFLTTHHGGVYPSDLASHIHPDNSRHPGGERYYRAMIDGPIDHDRETKRLRVVAAAMLLPTSDLQYFLLAVDPGFRRLGVGTAMWALLTTNGQRPTCWLYPAPAAVREPAEAFLRAVGIEPVEQGIIGERWGHRREPELWR